MIEWLKNNWSIVFTIFMIVSYKSGFLDNSKKAESFEVQSKTDTKIYGNSKIDANTSTAESSPDKYGAPKIKVQMPKMKVPMPKFEMSEEALKKLKILKDGVLSDKLISDKLISDKEIREMTAEPVLPQIKSKFPRPSYLPPPLETIKKDTIN